MLALATQLIGLANANMQDLTPRSDPAIYPYRPQVPLDCPTKEADKYRYTIINGE